MTRGWRPVCNVKAIMVDLSQSRPRWAPFPPRTRGASRTRFAAGLAAGSMSGGLIFALIWMELATLGVMGPSHQADFFGLQGVGRLFSCFILGTMIYAIGLSLAAPVWLVLHLARMRQWWTAMTLGGGLSILVARPSATYLRTPYPAPTPVESSVQWGALMVIGGIGAVVGLVIWRVAYRRAPLISSLALQSDAGEGDHP